MSHIIFQDWEVHAYMDGRKTMACVPIRLLDPTETYAGFDDDGWPWHFDDAGISHQDKCPFIVGERVCVKEAFRCEDRDCLFRADWQPVPDMKWQPASRMPKWASRLSPLITACRVARLDDLDNLDILATGFPSDSTLSPDDAHPMEWFYDTTERPFLADWDSNHKPPYQVDDAPFVWCVDIERYDPTGYYRHQKSEKTNVK